MFMKKWTPHYYTPFWSSKESQSEFVYRQPDDNELLRTKVRSYLNGNPTGLPPIETWDVSNVTDMSELFANQTFNEDISSWKTSKVVTMKGMFRNCRTFECYNTHLSWDTSEVTDMSYLFYGCRVFQGKLSSWNTGKVTTMRSMFEGCICFDDNISALNTNKVKDMGKMFKGCKFIPDVHKPHLTYIPPTTLQYDVILTVFLHGETTTLCPKDHKPNFANVTLLEASPCGVKNYCFVDEDNEHEKVQKFIRDTPQDPTFTTKLQSFLRKLKELREEYISDKDYTLFMTQRGWEILTKGYMERRYVTDKRFVNKVIVCYSSKDVFEKDENLIKSYNFIYSRTELMHLLKDSGYSNPLIIDFSCGRFYDNPETDSIEQRILEARELGVSG
jgi:surface protein